MLDDILKDTNKEISWQNRIKKRKGAYFMILKAWVEYVQRTVIKIDEVTWDEIPGYKIIKETLLKEI